MVIFKRAITMKCAGNCRPISAAVSTIRPATGHRQSRWRHRDAGAAKPEKVAVELASLERISGEADRVGPSAPPPSRRWAMSRVERAAVRCGGAVLVGVVIAAVGLVALAAPAAAWCPGSVAGQPEAAAVARSCGTRVEWLG